MKKLNLLVFLCLNFTVILYTQDTILSTLEYEYKELLKDMRMFGPQAAIPYYLNNQYYSTMYDDYLLDEDNDLVFAIYNSGFMKFIDQQGNVRYSRYLWLKKDSEGNLYGADGRCADEISEPNIYGLYSITAYLPKPEAKIKRIYLSMEIDEVYPVKRYMTSRKLNGPIINLVYVINRMIEILYHLKQLQPESVRTYDFKIRTLEMMLPFVIEDQVEFHEEYKKRKENNQQITQDDFVEIYKYDRHLRHLLSFLELEVLTN